MLIRHLVGGQGQTWGGKVHKSPRTLIACEDPGGLRKPGGGGGHPQGAATEPGGLQGKTWRLPSHLSFRPPFSAPLSQAPVAALRLQPAHLGSCPAACPPPGALQSSGLQRVLTPQPPAQATCPLDIPPACPCPMPWTHHV